MAGKRITLDDLKTIDLVELQAEIDADEKRLSEHVEKQRAIIDGKKQLYKTVDVLVNGKKKIERKPRDPGKAKITRSAVGGGPNVSDRVQDYLEISGASSPKAIAAAIGAEYQSVYSALNSNRIRFQKNGDGTYQLTK